MRLWPTSRASAEQGLGLRGGATRSQGVAGARKDGLGGGPHRCGQGAPLGLQLAEHRLEALGGLEGGRVFVAAPHTAGHEYPLTALLGSLLAQPLLAAVVAHITPHPEGLVVTKSLLGLD